MPKDCQTSRTCRTHYAAVPAQPCLARQPDASPVVILPIAALPARPLTARPPEAPTEQQPRLRYSFRLEGPPGSAPALYDVAWAEPGAVEGAAGVGEVQIRMTSPSRSDWKVATKTASGEYTARISLDLADALFGATLGYAVEVRAWDINENYREFEGTKVGAAVAVLNWVLEYGASTWDAVVDVVMSVINAIVEWVHEMVQFILDNLISPLVDSIMDMLSQIHTGYENIIDEINNWETYPENPDEVFDNLIEPLSPFYLPVEDLLEPIISFYKSIESIIEIIELFSMFFNPLALLMMLITTFASSIPGLDNMFESLQETAEEAIIEPILDITIGETGFFGNLGLYDESIDEESKPSLPSMNALANLGDFLNIGDPISIVITYIIELLDSGSRSSSRSFEDSAGAVILELIFSGLVIWQLSGAASHEKKYKTATSRYEERKFERYSPEGMPEDGLAGMDSEEIWGIKKEDAKNILIIEIVSVFLSLGSLAFGFSGHDVLSVFSAGIAAALAVHSLIKFIGIYKDIKDFGGPKNVVLATMIFTFLSVIFSILALSLSLGIVG